jgi:hypothetical protein
MSILNKTYLGAILPTLEYGMTVWATASKNSTSNLTKVQNMGLRLITGGMKSTQIHAIKKLTKIQPLDERRVEKVLVNRQKYIRLKLTLYI